MSKYFVMTTASIVSVVAVIGFELAAQGRGGPHGRGMRFYNPTTVRVVTGQVQEIVYRRGRRGGPDYSRGRRGRGRGIHLILKTADGVLNVHLGPSWYVQPRLKLKKGDTIEVTGSYVKFRSRPAIIAAVVKLGATTVILRDVKTGRPLWAGRGYRRGGGPGRGCGPGC